MDDADVTLTVDAKGLSCPLPVLKAKKALSEIEPDQVLKVISSDLGSRSDISVMVSRLGHVLLLAADSDGEISFLH